MDDGERGNPLKQKPPQGRSASGFVPPSTRCVVGWLVNHEGSLAPGGRILLPKKLGALPPGDDLLGSRIAADWECRQLHSAVIGVWVWVLLSFVYAGGSCLSTALPPATLEPPQWARKQTGRACMNTTRAGARRGTGNKVGRRGAVFPPRTETYAVGLRRYGMGLTGARD